MKPLPQAQQTAASGVLLSLHEEQSWRSTAETFGSPGEPPREGAAAVGGGVPHGELPGAAGALLESATE
jgi:hypothetical protein